jgi:hypothetical protein
LRRDIYFPTGEKFSEPIKNVKDGSSDTPNIVWAVTIDCQETAYFYTYLNVSKKAFAVTYTARLAFDQNVEWICAKTISNKACA